MTRGLLIARGMRPLVLCAVLLASTVAHAGAAVKIGSFALRSTRCTIEGPRPRLGEVMDGLAVTPDGAIVLIDADGALRRYRVRAGSGCTLTPDASFGDHGVLALGLGHDFLFARLDVDRAGTIYANVGGTIAGVRDGRVERMCGEGGLAASPRSDHLWRWFALGDVHREDAACKATGHANLAVDDDFGTIWVLDGNRIAVRADRGVRLFDADGNAAGQLVDFDATNFQLVRAVGCGRSICALGGQGFIMWGADGRELGRTQALVHLDDPFVARGLAIARGGAAYLLGNEYTDDEPRDRAVIVRVDGLPR